MQCYTQSKIELNYIIICYLPTQWKKKYSESIVLYIVKPLYSLVEAKNYWFATYLDHYKMKLKIEISLYDTYFFITKNNCQNFSIIGFQMDNIFNVKTEIFLKKEETKIIETKFKFKTQTIIKIDVLKDFNSCHKIIEVESIRIV